MLSQPLARRLVHNQAWSKKYGLHLTDALPRSRRLVLRGSAVQNRTVATREQQRRSSQPASKAIPASKAARQNLRKNTKSPPPTLRTPGTARAGEPSSATATSLRPSTTSGTAPSRLSLEYVPRTQTNEELRERASSDAIHDLCRRLLPGKHTEVLLYEAPSHGGLLFWSTLGGTCFLGQCLSTTSAFTSLDVPLYFKIPAMMAGTVGVICGGVMLSSTLKLLHTIHLVKTSAGDFQLRLIPRFRRIYFWQPSYVEKPLGEITRDRSVLDFLSTSPYRSVDVENSSAWTDYNAQHLTTRERLVRWWKNLPSALSRPFSKFSANAGKMFVRQGIALVGDGKTNWKLDMTEATFLNQGKSIQELLPLKKNAGRDLATIIRSAMDR